MSARPLERHDLSKITAPLVIPTEQSRMVFWAAIRSSLTPDRIWRRS